MIEELNRLTKIWNNFKINDAKTSIELVHMIQANINQFELITSWILQQKESSIRNRLPYFVPTEFNEYEPFGIEMQQWYAASNAISTLAFSHFMTSRSTTDNLYRLYLEFTQPKCKWGRYTSIKDGMKKEEFKGLFDDFDSFEIDFNRMRWIRNCFKAGAYCSSGGVEKDGSLFIHLLMPEKDNTVKNTDNRVTEQNMSTAISICSETLTAILKRY